MSSDIDIELNEMQEIVDDFLVEADELIESLDINLVKLESSPGDLDLLNEIFRAAHTIKGTSSFLGFEQVTGLTHKMEDILNKLRKSEISVTPSIMDVLLKSLDILKQLLQSVREGNKEEFDLTVIMGHLDAVLCGDDNDTSTSHTSEETIASVGEEISSTPEPAENSKTIDDLSKPETGSTPEQAKTKKAVEHTIRVDVDRLDALVNLTGEIVLGRNSLQQALNKFSLDHDGSDEFDGLNRAASAIDFITSELQLAVMKMRMQPIGKVFSRFPRQVRDLTRESGKEIDLIMLGESTELDKSVIEEIGDPLMHIIRNSCDHGIEPPEIREANGRNRRGTVKLSAFQEGSNIIIKVEDDGKGLDIEAIKSKAVERGLATQADINRMPEREVFRFIFNAGFSTAKVVTDVSGRGVGMDVVRSNIEKLNGLVELESAIGVGTTLTIKLPLTLAIVQGLLVESDEEVYVLPLSSVYETVRQEQANIYYVNQRPVLRLRDEIIPVINLGDILRSNSRGFVMSEKPYVIIVGLADRKLGINIDRFFGQEEVVIKSLGQYLGSTEGVAGATILGDGRIRLIVDLLGLFNIAGKLT